MIKFFEALPPTLVAIEAGASSHHWARLLTSFGHEVKQLPPHYVKPYVNAENDAADAEALYDAVTRPSMRFVPIKTREQQAASMLMTVRERLVSVNRAVQRNPHLCCRVRYRGSRWSAER